MTSIASKGFRNTINYEIYKNFESSVIRNAKVLNKYVTAFAGKKYINNSTINSYVKDFARGNVRQSFEGIVSYGSQQLINNGIDEVMKKVDVQRLQFNNIHNQMINNFRNGVIGKAHVISITPM